MIDDKDSSSNPQGGERPAEARAAEDALAEHAFQAAGPGSLEEVDPELVNLPRRRRRRHPLVAGVVIALSLYLLYFVRQDFLYFLQPRTPVDLGDVSQALKEGKLEAGRYVTLAGAADRKHALVLEARFGGYESIFRLLQTENRVFVEQHRESRGSDAALGGSYTGQLLPFRGLPYHRALEDYFARNVTLSHDLDLAALAAAKAQGGRARDQAGVALQLTPDTQFWINAAFPDEWLLQASKSEYATAEDAARRLGLVEAKVPYLVDESPPAFWRLVIKADAEQVRALMARFREIEARAKRPTMPPDPLPPQPQQNLVRRQVSFQARFDQLSVLGKELVINAADPTAPARYVVEKTADARRALRVASPAYADGAKLTPVREVPVRLPADAVLFISTSSPLRVPADAVVLLTGKRPVENWYYAVLYLLLFGFIAINSATLIQRLRERRRLG